MMKQWYRAVQGTGLLRPYWRVEKYLPMTRMWILVTFTNTKQAAVDAALRLNRDTMGEL